MPVPPIPPPLESLGQRPFSFYPPILNIEHNEWVYSHANWSEVVVRNTRTQQELFVPRQYVGEVSRIEAPIMIVGLRKELEFRSGQVWPHTRRVIEMPRAVGDYTRPALPTDEPSGPAPVIGIRLEHGPERRIGKLISLAVIVSLTATVMLVSFYRGRWSGNRVTYTGVLQSDFDLTGADDYFGVVRKWGLPAADRWRTGNGALQYRVLSYPDRGCYAILMGPEQNRAVYIGALDLHWRPIHTITLPHGGDTSALLRQLPRF